MKHNFKRLPSIYFFPISLALLILTVVLLSACANQYRTFSLVFDDINYSGSSSLFIALNNQPEIFGSFLSYGVTIEPGQPSARIDGIEWDNYNDDSGEDTAWLLVAEDTDDNGTLNEGDQLIPAMRILLPSEQDEIVISGLRFESGSNTVPLLYPDERSFGLSIFMSDPEQVSSMQPIYIFCYPGEDATVAMPESAGFIFNSADLVRQMVVRINQPASPHVLAWWDADSSGGNYPTQGDWISSDLTTIQNMDSDRSALILSPLIVIP